MSVRPWITLALVALTSVALAQDDEAPSDADADAETEASEDEPSVADDSLLLPGGIFQPSEKIEADSEVSLPADI